MTAPSRKQLFGILIGAVLIAASAAATFKRPPSTDSLTAEHEHPPEHWTCPMDPYVKQSEPGKCPKCGMSLVKKSGSELTVSTKRRQLIGLRLTKAEEREMTKTLIAAGAIAPDETRIVDVVSEIAGVVDQILGNPVGQRVRRGEPLFSVIGADGKKSLIRANATGHISWRVGFPNAQVTPKLKVTTIYDHANLWVWVEVYETEVAMIELGQRASLSVPAYPGRVFEGRVTQISPLLHPDTHTMRVRLDVPNPEYFLKPGMSAVVELDASLGTKLAIPEAAVIRTGTENVVFVSKGDGKLEVRDVKLGVQAAGWYEVAGGVEAGEQLVATASFLIDAESKLQGIRSSFGK